MRHAFVRAAATDEDEVLRHGTAGQFTHAALEADRADVVLTAAVRTTADFDTARRDQIDELGSCTQVFGELPAETARLRHGQAAAFRAGAADHVAQPPGVGLAETGGGNPLIER